MGQLANLPALPGYEAKSEQLSIAQSSTRMTIEAAEEVDITTFSEELFSILARYPEQEDMFIVRWETNLNVAKLVFTSFLDEIVASDETQIVGKIGTSLVQLQLETGVFRALLRETTETGMKNAWKLLVDRLLKNISGAKPELSETDEETDDDGEAKEAQQDKKQTNVAAHEEESFDVAAFAQLMKEMSSAAGPEETWKDWDDHQLQVAFQLGRELVAKLAMDVDFTQRTAGQSTWDAKQLVKTAVGMQYSQIPLGKSDYTRTGLVMLLDISGSCAEQAEMFAAIAAGAIGEGMTVFFGGNGDVYPLPMKTLRRFSSYHTAKAVVEQELRRILGPAAKPCWTFAEFVARIQPNRLIIFGDWDGRRQYVQAAKKQRQHNWYWFCNQQNGDNISEPCSEPQSGWTTRNYFSRILEPQALAKALRQVK